MPVADRDVSLVPQRVVRQAVGLEIQVHVAIRPVEDRMHLEAAIAYLEWIELRAALGLAAAQAREPAADAERLQRAPHGLDLADLEILVESCAALLPQLAVLRLELGHALVAGEGADVERQLLAQRLDELVGLGEQV